MEALESFTLICGDSQIAVTPSGITLSSPNITLAGKELDLVLTTLKATMSDQMTMSAKTATLQTAGASVALDASSAKVTASQIKLAGGSGSSAQASSEQVKVTKVQMKDSKGKPRANVRVLLTSGDEQRMTVLDANGMLELVGDTAYKILVPGRPEGGEVSPRTTQRGPGPLPGTKTIGSSPTYGVVVGRRAVGDEPRRRRATERRSVLLASEKLDVRRIGASDASRARDRDVGHAGGNRVVVR